MTLAMPLPAPAAALDGKRIAATSLAIVVHAVVLMMLMMPMQVADPPKVEDSDMQVTDIKPIPPIVKPPETRVRRPPTPQRIVETPRTPPTPVEVINDDPAPIDPYVEEVTLEPPTTGELIADPQPSFARLRADVAPPPAYPPQALRLRQQGLVMLRVLVDEAGRPAEVVLEASSGFRLLDEAAMKVVRKRWHFVPATRDGTAIQAWALVPVSFELRG